MSRSKSLYRQPGAQHFQVVHRSQRDPLIHDPDANQHVLKPVDRSQKGRTRADLETVLPSTVINHDSEARVGEAALYGIYYDDTKYDYLQHLRQVGLQEEGVESTLIETPLSVRRRKQTQTQKGTVQIGPLDLPPESLAPSVEPPRTYESQQAVPESIAGLQPDMNPHLRQVLESLDDDAFVDDDVDDDFFRQLVVDGQRQDNEPFEFEFQEDEVEPMSSTSGSTMGEEVTEWKTRFSEFMQSQREARRDGGSEYGFGYEDDDSVSSLPDSLVIGGKRRRRRTGASDASGYSMSSSSIYRNDGLQTLDERFDQMILKEYNEGYEDMTTESDDSDEDPDLATSREDLDAMVNEFLNDFEILGRKLKPKLTGESGPAKLDTIRRAMGRDDRVYLRSEEEDVDDLSYIPYDMEEKRDIWDCETILTTHSNLENHPRLIRAGSIKAAPKIALNPKTGLPVVISLAKTQDKGCCIKSHESDGDNETISGGTERPAEHRAGTICRQRDETKEEKKARKAAVKAEHQARRHDKKANKELFGSELQKQKMMTRNKEPKLQKL